MKSKILDRSAKYATHHPLGRNTPSIITEQTSERMEGVVVDVIVNEDHPEYKADGYNVGCVRFRSIDTDQFKPDDKLHWAYPIDSTFSEFPLKFEIVHIYSSLNRLYYTRKINVGNGPSNQAMTGLESEMKPVPGESAKIGMIEKSKFNPTDVTAPTEDIGTYFKKVPKLLRLRHWEGDIVFEGRTGQSIRFGSSWKDPSVHKNHVEATTTDQSPNIMIRTGPDLTKTTGPFPYGRTLENINDDKTSLWILADQVVALKPATLDKTVHKKSITNYPTKFDGAQLIINSDRLVFNSKKTDIMNFSARDLNNSSVRDNTLDAGRDFYSWIGRNSTQAIQNKSLQTIGSTLDMWVGSNKTISIGGNYNITSNGLSSIRSKKKVNIIAPDIYLGMEGSRSEPMVLGETLRKLLIVFIKAHLNNASRHVVTTMGPGVLNPAIIKDLTKILAELEGKSILSESNFLAKKNTNPDGIFEKPVTHND